MKGRNGSDSRPFYIAGTDYSFAKGDEAFAAQREDYVRQTLDGVPDDAFIVMLAHHSAFIDEAFEHNIPLTLSGHTHGAQFAPSVLWLRPWALNTCAACSERVKAGVTSTAVPVTGCFPRPLFPRSQCL